MPKRAVTVIWILLCAEGVWLYRHLPEWRAARAAAASEVTESSTTASSVTAPSVASEATAKLIELSQPEPAIDTAPAFAQAAHFDEPACLLPATAAVTTAVAPQIYQWTDAEGRKHFGDRPPAGANATGWQSQALARPDYFKLSIEHRGEINAPQFRNELTPQVQGIYQILGDMIGRDQLRKVDLNISLYPDMTSYLAFAQSLSNRDMSGTNGFYSTAINEAVTFMQPDFRKTMEVARHESTHVIIAGVLGHAPLWLNEGLAQYFSFMSIAALGKTINEDALRKAFAIQSVQQGYPGIAALLELDATQWRGASQQSHYAVSWALVYFMMSSEQGKTALARVMQQLATNYCRPVDSRATLNASYAGGIDQLQQDFYQWLGDGANKAPHYY